MFFWKVIVGIRLPEAFQLATKYKVDAITNRALSFLVSFSPTVIFFDYKFYYGIPQFREYFAKYSITLTLSEVCTSVIITY